MSPTSRQRGKQSKTCLQFLGVCLAERGDLKQANEASTLQPLVQRGAVAAEEEQPQHVEAAATQERNPDTDEHSTKSEPSHRQLAPTPSQASGIHEATDEDLC